MKTLLVAILAALLVPSAAFAHARISPPFGLKGESQVWTLAVPTERDDAATTAVALTVPAGFDIDSFVPSPGWKRTVTKSTVTWSGGHVPTDEDATFSFLAGASTAKTYTFEVRQTYSDGTVVDWNGAESSDTPSPTIDVRSSLGGGGAGSTLVIVALVIGALGFVVGAVGLVAGGKRPLA